MTKTIQILLIQLFIFLTPVCAQTTDSNNSYLKSTSQYQEASQEYENGNISKALELLKNVCKTNDPQLAADSWHLMAKCHVENGDIKSVENDVNMMMQNNPYYVATSVENPIIVDFINKVRLRSATITTASQQAESIEESPVPVTLITREMIDASGANNLQDILLMYVPGMSKIEGIEANLAMRGTYNHTQENILIMLDGNRLNSRTTNSEAPDYRTSIDKIDHIEVLRGPASSLYGNVALTSVVNIITKRGNQLNGNQLSMQYGSNKSTGFSLMRGKGGFSHDYLAWASIYASDGEAVSYTGTKYLDPNSTYTSFLNGYKHTPSFDIGTKIRWEDVNINVSIQNSKRVPYENMFSLTGYTYDKYITDHGIKPGASRMTINAFMDYNHTWNKFTLSASAFGNFERTAQYIAMGDVIDPDISQLLSYLMGGTSLGTQYSWINLNWQDYTFGGKVSAAYSYGFGSQSGTIMGGVQYEHFMLTGSNVSLGNGETDNGQVHDLASSTDDVAQDGNERTVSAFLQLKHKFTSSLIFNGGLRYDNKHRFNDETLSILSPRASMIWLPSKVLSLRASYAYSFVDAPYIYRASQLPFYQGNVDLNPEKMNSVQLGFACDWKQQHLKWETNLFFNNIKDLVVVGGKFIFSETAVQSQFNTLLAGKTMDEIIEWMTNNREFLSTAVQYLKLDNMFSNAGKTNIGGIESILTYNTPTTLATMNLTFQYPFHNEENDTINLKYITNVPKFIANVVASQQVLKFKKAGSIWVHANVHAQTGMKENKTNMILSMVLRSFHKRLLTNQNFVCTANAGVEWKTKKIRLGVDVNNIFNTYYTIGSGTSSPTPQQSRNFMAKATFNF